MCAWSPCRPTSSETAWAASSSPAASTWTSWRLRRAFPGSARLSPAKTWPSFRAAKAQIRRSQRRIGSDTALIGRLGDDASGRGLKAFLSRQRVDLRHVTATDAGPHRDRDHHGLRWRQHHRGGTGRECAGRAVRRRGTGHRRPEMCWSASSKSRPPRSRRSSARGRAAGARPFSIPRRSSELGRDPPATGRYRGAERDRARRPHRSDVGADARARAVIALARSLQPTKDQIVCVTLGRRGAVALWEATRSRFRDAP